jgi:hypothetical protein
MTSVDLQTIALAAGDTAPHGMDELYNVQFTDGTYSPASGAISLNDFRNKTIGAPGIQTKTFSYTGLTNLMGTSNQRGTWRCHTFTTWTLPTGFSSNSPDFSLTVNINGTLSGRYFVSGEHFGNVGMAGTGTTNTAARSTHGTSALNPTSYGPTDGVNGAVYNWTRTKSTLNDTAYTLSAGDTVNIYICQYVEYWKTLDIEYIITW